MCLKKECFKFAGWKLIFGTFVWTALTILTTTCTAFQTCEIPSVQEMTSTNLTCTFDVNVGTLLKTIVVLHYRANDSNDPERVLYSALFQDNLEYFVRPGFTVIGKVTNSLHLKIDRVTKNHVGRYECHILPSVTEDARSCRLLLKASDAPTTSLRITNTVLPHLPRSSEDPGGNLHYMEPLVIIMCIVLIGLLFGFIVAIVVFYKRKLQETVASEDKCKEPKLLPDGSQSNPVQP